MPLAINRATAIDTRTSKTIMPIDVAIVSVIPYWGLLLMASNTNKHTGDTMHKKAARAMDLDVVTLTARKAFASPMDTRFKVETVSDGVVYSASSISSFSR